MLQTVQIRSFIPPMWIAAGRALCLSSIMWIHTSDVWTTQRFHSTDKSFRQLCHFLSPWFTLFLRPRACVTERFHFKTLQKCFIFLTSQWGFLTTLLSWSNTASDVSVQSRRTTTWSNINWSELQISHQAQILSIWKVIRSFRALVCICFQ